MTPLAIGVTVAACALALILIALFLYLSDKWLCVTKYALSFENAPAKSVKIAHLSDLHAAKFGRGNARLLKKVKEQSPDFIAFTGDLIGHYRPKEISVALEAVEELKKIAPVYVVSGNHEMRDKKWREFKVLLEERGATVLDNSSESAFGINVCGVNCACLKNNKLFEVADSAEGFKLLLAHKPELISRYALAGYDLALCGHAHGGQWRIPFADKGVFAPGQGLFPQYSSGVHRLGNMCEVISRGLGNSECPIRLFNRPEIVVITINNSDGQ